MIRVARWHCALGGRPQHIKLPPRSSQIISLFSLSLSLSLSFAMTDRTACSSVYGDAVWHAELTFPDNYPSSPPNLVLLTSFPHAHVFSGRVCLSILSNEFSSHFKDMTGHTAWRCAVYAVAR